MKIEEIQNKLSEEITISHEKWGELLTNTEPGNYGANDWEVSLNPNDIWVDIPNKKFSFRIILFKKRII
jgi:hypothetical protein